MTATACGFAQVNMSGQAGDMNSSLLDAGDKLIHVLVHPHLIGVVGKVINQFNGNIPDLC